MINTTNNNHHILRKDVSSNKMLPKQNLIRIVKDKNGNITLDSTGKANGRGVYLAPNLDALEKVKKNNSLSRGLKTKISDDIYEKIATEIRENWD